MWCFWGSVRRNQDNQAEQEICTHSRVSILMLSQSQLSESVIGILNELAIVGKVYDNENSNTNLWGFFQMNGILRQYYWRQLKSGWDVMKSMECWKLMILRCIKGPTWKEIKKNLLSWMLNQNWLIWKKRAYFFKDINIHITILFLKKIWIRKQESRIGVSVHDFFILLSVTWFEFE